MNSYPRLPRPNAQHADVHLPLTACRTMILQQRKPGPLLHRLHHGRAADPAHSRQSGSPQINPNAAAPYSQYGRSRWQTDPDWTICSAPSCPQCQRILTVKAALLAITVSISPMRSLRPNRSILPECALRPQLCRCIFGLLASAAGLDSGAGCRNPDCQCPASENPLRLCHLSGG